MDPIRGTCNLGPHGTLILGSFHGNPRMGNPSSKYELTIFNMLCSTFAYLLTCRKKWMVGYLRLGMSKQVVLPLICCCRKRVGERNSLYQKNRPWRHGFTDLLWSTNMGHFWSCQLSIHPFIDPSIYIYIIIIYYIYIYYTYIYIHM